MVDRDVKEDSHGGEADDQARAAVRDERKRDPGERREAEHGAHVHRGLPADERGEPRGEELAEGFAASEGDVEAGIAEHGERGDDSEGPQEPELFADDREDHVRGGLRQVVDLLDGLAQPDAEDSPGAQGDHRLHRLEAPVLGILPRVEKGEDPLPPVGLEPDRGEHDDGTEGSGAEEHGDPRPRHHQHGSHHDGYRYGGAEVRLDEDESAREPDDEAQGPGELAEGLGRRPPGEIGGHPEGERELGDLGRLQRGGTEGEPAAGAVHGVAEDEDGQEEDEARGE
jgi:hypothetical protein